MEGQPTGVMQKQAAMLLQYRFYAWLMAGLLAIIPFAMWLSAAVVALITLRKGVLEGCKCLIVALTVCACWFNLIGVLPDVLYGTLLTYMLCFVCAVLLRHAASWRLLGLCAVVATLGILCGVQWLFPDWVLQQSVVLKKIVQTFDKGSLIFPALSSLDSRAQWQWAWYFLGMRALSILVAAIASLMLARHIQSMLFYPGAFKEELLAFRASFVGVVMLVVTAWGASRGNLLGISCLPVFFVYVMLAGVSLFYHVMQQKKIRRVTLAVFTPMVVLPYVAFPAYCVFGALDSVFNLRQCWPFGSKKIDEEVK